MMNLKILRAINQAQIQTLAEQGDSDELFRAQVVGKILADDQCLQLMEVDELADVLVALGFKADAACEQAQTLKAKKLSKLNY